MPAPNARPADTPGSASATALPRLALDHEAVQVARDQFAFQETLAATTTTEGGAQHPAYDIRMAGTGDVVMTDVRQASSAIVLDPSLDGRFYVRDAHRRLVVELYKPAARRAEIAVEPGLYEVQYEKDRRLFRHEVVATDGQRHTLKQGDFGEIRRGATAARGDPGPPRRERHRWV